MASQARQAIKQNRDLDSLKVQVAEMQLALKRIEEKLDLLISEKEKREDVSGK